MKKIVIAIIVLGLSGCSSSKNYIVGWNWACETLESHKEHAIYDFSSPLNSRMDRFGPDPAHYRILLPPKKEIIRILGYWDDRCIFFTKKRGIAIFLDLHGWERKYDKGLREISKEFAAELLSRFAVQNGKEIKLKEKRHHYMYVEQEIMMVMFNLTDDDYNRYVEFPIGHLMIRQRNRIRLRGTEWYKE